jgi:hypothetical protein
MHPANLKRINSLITGMLCHYFDMLSHNKLDTEQPGMLLYYLRMRPNHRTACSKDRGIKCDITMQFPGQPGTDLINYLWGGAEGG